MRLVGESGGRRHVGRSGSARLFKTCAAGTPGPSNHLLTATGANVGVVRGLP
jgi:hypothetical protein